MREALGPLVDGAGDREMARQLGEVQRNKRLAEDDQRPRPEDRWTADAERDRLVREHSGRDTDVAEGDREVRQEAERSPQFRFDAQRP